MVQAAREAGLGDHGVHASRILRIVSQQVFAGRAIAVAEVAELLLRNTAHPKHTLVPLDFGFAEVMGACTGGLLGHRQITDAWLLTAAVRAGMKLVTFDAGIGQLLATPRERNKHVSLLGPARA